MKGFRIMIKFSSINDAASEASKIQQWYKKMGEKNQCQKFIKKDNADYKCTLHPIKKIFGIKAGEKLKPLGKDMFKLKPEGGKLSTDIIKE